MACSKSNSFSPFLIVGKLFFLNIMNKVKAQGSGELPFVKNMLILQHHYFTALTFLPDFPAINFPVTIGVSVGQLELTMHNQVR